MLQTASARNRAATRAAHADRQFDHLTQSTPTAMSQHRSLRAASTSGAKRNVLKRFERVAILKKRGQWKTGDRVTGLRKTKPEA